MNTTRPATLEEVTASAGEQIRAAERYAADAYRKVAVYRRYARMLRKKWKRAEALARMREDD